MQIAIPTIYGPTCAIAAFFWAITHRKDQSVSKLLYAILGISLMYGWAFPALLNFENRLVPWKFDELLFRLDGALGLSVITFQDTIPYWLSVVFAIIYKSLLWVITTWGWLHLVKPSGNFRAVVIAFAGGYAAAGLLYLIVPACGPGYAMSHFRGYGSFAPIRFEGEPNAMPSMDVASALILVLFAGPNRWLRTFSILFLIGTCFGTILGEHYFVDWIGAIPLACFAAALGRREKHNAAVYLAATLALLVSIRFAGPFMVLHPAILQTAALVMMVVGADAVARAWTKCAGSGCRTDACASRQFSHIDRWTA